jgi:hypothetical protein
LGSGRSIDGNSERAYRVVRVDEEGNYTFTRYGGCYGPYSTLAAAKGKRTNLTSGYYGDGEKYIIEQTTAGWEKVEV